MNKNAGLVKSNTSSLFEKLNVSPVAHVWHNVNFNRSLSDNITEIEKNTYDYASNSVVKFLLHSLIPLAFSTLSISLYMTDVISGLMLTSMLVLSLLQLAINRDYFTTKMKMLYSQWSYSVNSLISLQARHEFFLSISQAIQDPEESKKVNTELLTGYSATHLGMCVKVQDIIDRIDVK